VSIDIFVLYVVFSFILIFLLLTVSLLVKGQDRRTEKLLPYECGFMPFNDARQAFNVDFYIIAILFLIFDVEITLLIPYILIINPLNMVSFWIFYFLLCLLFLGFVLEWRILSKKEV
jgi:NADH:ubiquinone oxidoreductase subunit 3 (subunit A)